MHLGGLLSTQDSYASFVLSNLPRASITPWLHAARLPFLKYICCAFMLSVPFFIVFSWYFSVFSLNKSVYKTLTDNWKKKSAD